MRPNQHLSLADAREIRRLKKTGVSGTALARQYDVTTSTIYNIMHDTIHIDRDAPMELDPRFPATSFVAGKLLR